MLDTDLKSVLDQSIRILQCMIEIAGEEAQLQSAMHCILLLQCLIQGTHPFQSSLAVLPNLKPPHIKRLCENRVECLPELLEQEGKVMQPPERLFCIMYSSDF